MPASHGSKSAASPAVQSALARLEEFQRARRLQTVLFIGGFAALLVISALVSEVSWQQFQNGVPRFFRYIERTLPELTWSALGTSLAEWFWGFPKWMKLMADTVLIAFLATIAGGTAALIASFFAARNTARNGVEAFVIRRIFEVCRTVPDLVFALIFVYAFGIGAMAGVFAIALHTFGTLGKLNLEIHEAADPRPIEGLHATGAPWAAIMRYSVLPQGAPTLLAYMLLRFEINVRGAAVVGFVGAGGIGQEISFVIKQFIYQDISALLIILAVTVMLIDSVSSTLRRRLIGAHALA